MRRASLLPVTGLLLLIGMNLTSCGAKDPLATCRGHFTSDVNAIGTLSDAVQSALRANDIEAMRAVLQQAQQPLSNIDADIASCMKMMQGMNAMMTCQNALSGDENAIQAMLEAMQSALQMNDPVRIKAALEEMEQLLSQMQAHMNSCMQSMEMM